MVSPPDSSTQGTLNGWPRWCRGLRCARTAHPNLGQDRPRTLFALAAASNAGGETSDLQVSGTQAMVRDHWESVLGTRAFLDADFADLGGGSLTAAGLVAAAALHPTRGGRWPTSTTTRGWPNWPNAHLDEMATPASVLGNANVSPVPPKTQRGQLLALLPLRTGLR